MQHRREDDDHADPLERGRVAVLRLDDVGHGIGNRSVVTDAAGEDVVDARPHALDHHAAGEHAVFDGRADPAARLIALMARMWCWCPP